jgi:hypothetical protein
MRLVVTMTNPEEDAQSDEMLYPKKQKQCTLCVFKMGNVNEYLN